MTSKAEVKLHFTSIERTIWHLKGEEKAEKGSEESNHPTVILILAWMGAQLRHLSKFAEKYHELYPSADQFILLCETPTFWESQNATDRRLAPLAKALVSLGCVPPTNQRILIHAFSNGGGLQLIALTKLLPSSQVKDQLPTSGLIIDSAPGRMDLDTITEFNRTQLRNVPGGFFIGLLFKALYTYATVARSLGFKAQDPLSLLTETLLTDQTLPWADKKTPRLYIYSQKDQLIPWDHVQKHVREARELGLDVQEEVYESSPHVGHCHADPEKYWRAVEKLWEQAIKVSVDRKELGYKL